MGADERHQSGDETGKVKEAVLLYDEAAGLQCQVGGQPKEYHLHLSQRQKMP